MNRRADAPAGAKNRTSAFRKPRVDKVPRNVIAEISAEPVPTASGGNSLAVRTQKTIPRTEVSPVPATSAYALRRIGSRSWVGTLAAIPVVISGRCRDPYSIDLECRREFRCLARRSGIDPAYGEIDHQVHRFVRNLVAGHPPDIFAINEEGQPSRLPVQSNGVPAFGQALSRQ